MYVTAFILDQQSRVIYFVVLTFLLVMRYDPLIKRSILSIAIVAGIGFLGLILSVSWYAHSQLELAQNAATQRFALLSSRIERLSEDASQSSGSIELIEADTGTAFLEQLSLIPEVVAWELMDHQNRLVTRWPNSNDIQNNKLVHKDFYLSASTPENQTSRLSVYFDLTQEFVGAAPIFWQGLYLSLLIWLLFSIVAYLSLRWVFLLEQRATESLLSNQFNIFENSDRSSIIEKLVCNLANKNRLLAKEKTELTEQIRKTTYIDSVTELGNHLFFKAELEVRLHNHDELESGLVMILAFAELEDYPASAGKGMQLAIASCLRNHLDSVENSIVAQLKTSEFALILPNLTSRKIDQFCRRLIKELSIHVYSKPESLHHFVNIGISSYKQGFDYFHVMAETDLALRNAQLQGANSWYFYGEAISPARARGRLKWQSFLRQVLKRRKIELFCQRLNYFKVPQKKHHEILARVYDGEELLNAESFCSMAFQCGLGVDFDRQIVNAVINHILFAHKNDDDCQYSVNIFVPSLLDKEFTQWLASRFQNDPSLSGKLIFEISESWLKKHLGQVNEVMNQLSELGVRWCVEHFASIGDDQHYLNELEVAFIKIDRRIVHNISSSQQQKLLFNSIIVSLQSKEITLIAEGLERQQDLAYIQQTQVDAAQGYMLDRPQKMSHDPKVRLAGSQ
jgi:RNase E specificity factor CsrD